MLVCMALDTAVALRDHYPIINEACERLSAREGRLHFAPDIYATLLRGGAKGFVLLRAGEAVGFFMVQGTADSEDRPALQLWIGYARPGTGDDVFETGMNVCESIAVAEGRVTFVFGTHRRGWLKRAPHYGFELKEYLFEKRVSA